VIAAGSISQTFLGRSSFATKSWRSFAPVAFSATRLATAEAFTS
jgi:hypothetical protein